MKKILILIILSLLLVNCKPRQVYNGDHYSYFKLEVTYLWDEKDTVMYHLPKNSKFTIVNKGGKKYLKTLRSPNLSIPDIVAVRVLSVD